MENANLYDVVVVGGGGAGFCAAMQAAQQGKRVALLEKAPAIGGSSAMARGVGAVGARDQLASPKWQFTVQELLQDWMELTYYLANYPLIYTYLSNSGATVDWLQDMGCRLEYVGSVQDKHNDSPFQTYFLWGAYKGGEMRRLIRRLEENGGKLYTRTTAHELICEEGRVVGVLARSGEERFPIYGKAVILCAGGYGNNPDMVAEATGGVKVNAINTGTQTGDGILLGISAGGDTENLHAIEFHGCDSPCDKISRSKIGGHGNELSKLCQFQSTIWVNRNGYRFTGEEIGTDISYIGNVVYRQGSEYFVLLDQRMVDLLATQGAGALGVTTDVRGILPDVPWVKLPEQLEEGLQYTIVYKGDSWEQVAEAAGVAPTVLAQTVERYNGYCANGLDLMYGKNPQLLQPLYQAPFYLVEGRANQLCSLGGLRIDTEMRVLSPDFTPIPGLYAAGCDASGGLVNNAYVSYEGVTMGWACTSGRLAGLNACLDMAQ